MNKTKLEQGIPAWFWQQTTLWGDAYNNLDVTAPSTAYPQGLANAQLAYEIALQLSSRIATNRLPAQAGLEAAALTSAYALFPYARERVVIHGPAAQASAALVWWMLNRDVRPFTAYWHRVSEKGLLATADARRRFRRELEHLQKGLAAWSALFTQIANPEAEVALLTPATDGPFHPPLFDGDRMAKSPATQDGLAVPTPFEQAYKAVVGCEASLINEWRTATGRGAGSLLSGIALSGGGIRSATFALGVLRQLALALPVFAVDYISTVSGRRISGQLDRLRLR